jgi:hypothetical protein
MTKLTDAPPVYAAPFSFPTTLDNFKFLSNDSCCGLPRLFRSIIIREESFYISTGSPSLIATSTVLSTFNYLPKHNVFKQQPSSSGYTFRKYKPRCRLYSILYANINPAV